VEILRTPDERFADLPGWRYEPHYTDVAGVRIHHAEMGRPRADPIVLIHGEPSWGFLYRKMMPILGEAGHRVVVPDLVGFGRSDKPSERADYSYARHVEWITGWLLANDLSHITFFGQDWGGLIGLRVVAALPDRFDRVVIGNTGLPTGDQKPTDAFLAWQNYSQTSEHFNIGNIVQGGCATRPLPPEVVSAYDAPFPDESYKEGARMFPVLVPTRPDDPASDDNRRAWEVLSQWTKPFVCAFSDQDAITRGGDRAFLDRVPGCAGQPHTTIEGGGHFLQEDRGPEVAAVILATIEQNPR
jgi:haloalkane dehalogenase